MSWCRLASQSMTSAAASSLPVGIDPDKIYVNGGVSPSGAPTAYGTSGARLVGHALLE